MKRLLLTAAAFLLASCNRKEETVADSGSPSAAREMSYVSAVIGGQPWRSDSLLVRYSETSDRLSIHTTDNEKKKDLVLNLAPFSKTKTGSYNSDKLQRNGISLLDADKADGVEFDFDNYLERESPDCIQITSIKDLGNQRQVIEGTFKSEMLPSFNAAEGKPLQVQEGKFRVIFDVVADSRP